MWPWGGHPDEHEMTTGVLDPGRLPFFWGFSLYFLSLSLLHLQFISAGCLKYWLDKRLMYLVVFSMPGQLDIKSTQPVIG